jgi:hypothetical protein
LDFSSEAAKRDIQKPLEMSFRNVKIGRYFLVNRCFIENNIMQMIGFQAFNLKVIKAHFGEPL